MRPLTLLQRQRITLSLFFTVAVGAVFTVATPAFVPWKVVDDKRAQALDQQRRQNKDFHVIENRRRSGPIDDQEADAIGSSSSYNDASSSTSISHQGPIISLLTDRSRQMSTAGSEDTRPTNTEESETEPTPKKRRRRRRRKMVNEGWQELTGRTAREEKEKEERKHGQNHPEKPSGSAASLGENGGKEIVWKNKSQ
ncbi:hypothetical protein FBU30_010450 [Linnemannia zychae]|nr:hypothetical protein FBU30_010450 [Linnemannia zychae]